MAPSKKTNAHVVLDKTSVALISVIIISTTAKLVHVCFRLEFRCNLGSLECLF